MRIRLADAPHMVALMSPEDQRKYGPGIHPADDPHPPLKTDKLEREEQRQFASYCLLKELPFSWHATNARTKATPGTPDFWVGVNRLGLWIEFKRDYTCKLSEEQQEFAAKLERQGMKLYVVYSALEAIELLNYFDRVI
jgi:hypothetical protein